MAEYQVLPAYFVIDNSPSMSERSMGESTAFGQAITIFEELYEEMANSPMVSDMLRVGAITFNDEARSVLPLGNKNDLADWLKAGSHRALTTGGKATYYGKAFSLLHTEIIKDLNQIKADKLDGVSFTPFRPVVFFFTDAEANDDVTLRNKAFEELTDSNFIYKPNIVCIGVGDASFDNLKPYAAGTDRGESVKNPQYKAGYDKYVFIATPGTSPAKAIAAIIKLFISSLITSLTSGAASAQTAQSGDNGNNSGGSNGSGGNNGEVDDPFTFDPKKLADPDLQAAFNIVNS